MRKSRTRCTARSPWLAALAFCGWLIGGPVAGQNVNVTIDATDCSPRVLFDGTEATAVDGGSMETLSVAPGPYNPQLVPGGFPGSVNVGLAGNVSYDAALEGAVYTGSGTSTLAIVGHTTTVTLPRQQERSPLADPFSEGTAHTE
jgi:hypothetical protein